MRFKNRGRKISTTSILVHVGKKLLPNATSEEKAKAVTVHEGSKFEGRIILSSTYGVPVHLMSATDLNTVWVAANQRDMRKVYDALREQGMASIAEGKKAKDGNVLTTPPECGTLTDEQIKTWFLNSVVNGPLMAGIIISESGSTKSPCGLTPNRAPEAEAVGWKVGAPYVFGDHDGSEEDPDPFNESFDQLLAEFDTEDLCDDPNAEAQKDKGLVSDFDRQRKVGWRQKDALDAAVERMTKPLPPPSPKPSEIARSELQGQLDRNFDKLFEFVPPSNSENLADLFENTIIRVISSNGFKVTGVAAGKYEVSIYSEREVADWVICVALKLSVAVADDGTLKISILTKAKRVMDH